MCDESAALKLGFALEDKSTHVAWEIKIENVIFIMLTSS